MQQREWRSLCPLQQHGSTGEHYAKWNKAGGEGQIPYDLTFNWNIINRRKNQAKYNQRHWSEEQSNNGQGGVGRGQWGEGITGTTLKDTWRKSRRRVEVREGDGFSWGGLEGWGERAHISNWITIKNKIKKKWNKQPKIFALNLNIPVHKLFGWFRSISGMMQWVKCN